MNIENKLHARIKKKFLVAGGGGPGANFDIIQIQYIYNSIKQGILNYDELVNRLKTDLLYYGRQFFNPLR